MGEKRKKENGIRLAEPRGFGVLGGEAELGPRSGRSTEFPPLLGVRSIYISPCHLLQRGLLFKHFL